MIYHLSQSVPCHRVLDERIEAVGRGPGPTDGYSPVEGLKFALPG